MKYLNVVVNALPSIIKTAKVVIAGLEYVLAKVNEFKGAAVSAPPADS